LFKLVDHQMTNENVRGKRTDRLKLALRPVNAWENDVHFMAALAVRWPACYRYGGLSTEKKLQWRGRARRSVQGAARLAKTLARQTSLRGTT
jgi:hypothetical protein